VSPFPPPLFSAWSLVFFSAFSPLNVQARIEARGDELIFSLSREVPGYFSGIY